MLSPGELQIVLLSLQVAAVALIATLPLAVFLAFILARRHNLATQILNVAVHLPLVMPPVVTGYVLLILFGRGGTLGQIFAKIGLIFSFNWTGAALAAGVMALPLMVRPMRVAFEAVDRRLEGAASTLGASRLQVWTSVTLPLAAPGVFAGAITGFAKCLGEFGATITFVSSIPGVTETMPLAIHGLLQIPGQDAAAWRLCAIAIVIAILALAVSEWVTRRIHARARH